MDTWTDRLSRGRARRGAAVGFVAATTSVAVVVCLAGTSPATAIESSVVGSVGSAEPTVVPAASNGGQAKTAAKAIATPRVAGTKRLAGARFSVATPEPGETTIVR
ncbi:MAG: hypothetical protein WCI74_09985, partial [Actinomycetes bacterium]